MREKLQAVNGLRTTFEATFARFGTKTSFKGPAIKTLLFQHVKDLTGREVCDHIWFTNNKQFEKLQLSPGWLVRFDARVKAYTKGYKGWREDEEFPAVETDYKLSHPTNVRKWLPSKDDGGLPLFDFCKINSNFI